MRNAVVIAALTIFAFALAVAPAGAAPPIIGPVSVSNVLGSTAHLDATVDPGESAGIYAYQISTDDLNWSYFGGAEGFLTANGGPQGAPGELSSLNASTKYFVRLVVFAETTVISAEPNAAFTTLAVAPPEILSFVGATDVTNYTAKVSASVERPPGSDPALNSSCRFEYISEAAYGPHSEKQRLTVRATGGTYVLGFAGESSAPIAFNAPAATVQAALEALAAIGPGTVTVSGGPGSPNGASPYTIAFGASLADKNVEQISADASGLTGPVVDETEVKSAEVMTPTEGHPEGFETALQAPCSVNPIKDPGARVVRAKLTGLSARTTYRLRLVLSNAGGSNIQEAPKFTTTGVPVLQTSAARNVEPTSATLGGKVNPVAGPVTYQFEWGVEEGKGDETYENLAPATPEALAFEDESFHLVTTQLSGLSPATTYHYRISATNTQTNESSLGVDRIFTTGATPGGPSPCPNESSRVGPSAGLPDCRAYEWVTPDINNIFSEGGASALADGSAIKYVTSDAPDNASGSFVLSPVVSRRSSGGWASLSLSASTPAPVEFFSASGNDGLVSGDLTEAIVFSSVSLDGQSRPPEQEILYLRRADGTYVAISPVGEPMNGDLQPVEVAGGTRASGDFKHIFFRFPAGPKQLDSDPVNGGGNTYEWVGGEVRLIGILPGEIPAPQGALLAEGALPGVSYDGRLVLFKAAGFSGLYLRTDGKNTVEPSASQRTVDPEPYPPAAPSPVGVTADGSKVLFTSRSELTNDANTGTLNLPEPSQEVKGQGDLYSYDVQSKVLTDLTVDDNPEDEATGANVSGVVGINSDASFIYFIATGNLAKGAVSGEPNLYVEHNGNIDFVAPGGGLGDFYVTPNGEHIAFASTQSLTGYDNNAEKTKKVEQEPGVFKEEDYLELQAEVFKYSYKGAVECVSCRPSGDLPTGAAGIHGRAISNDGSRVFFQSADRVLPQASPGFDGIYEYEDGVIHLLVPGDLSHKARLLDASASGDDVFIAATEELVPGAGEVFAIYDARVNADVSKPSRPACQGEACRGPASSPLPGASPGSASFSAPVKIAGPKSESSKGSKARLRLSVPGAGRLSISGRGLKPSEKRALGSGSVAIAATLKPGANATRLSKGVFRTKARVVFSSSSGSTSVAEVALEFEGPTEKGGK